MRSPEVLTEICRRTRLRASPILAARLTAAEGELERPRSEQATVPEVSVAAITRLIADLPARAERAVVQLERTPVSGDIPCAREEIRTKVASVTVEADKREVRLYSEQGDVVASLLRVPGSHARLSCKYRW